MRTYRRGNFAIYLSQEYCFYETDSPEMFELIDRRCQYERLRKMGFLQYDKMISYKYILKKDIDFDKISEEVLTEFLASIKTDSEAAKIQIENIAKISSRVCSSILAKYHQELLKD